MTMDMDRSPAWPAAEDARVVVHDGPDAGAELTWTAGDVTVGTASSADLLLSDPAVSARHCVLQRGDAGVSVRDLRSTNGTFVGRCRVGAAHLSPGMILRLGDTRLSVHAGAAPRVDDGADRYGRLLGRSEPMQRLFARIRTVADSGATVLIEGETGTGKELVAETLHRASSRHRQPFCVFDCARVTPSVMESELFGHVRGAFTGAERDRPGVFESADRGTVFLDELGELPLDLQPKLLRVLDRQQVSPVGTARSRRVDVRVIAATNRNLRREVACGRFRADLYYRLQVVTLTLPPLRERGDDVELLARHFLRRLSRDPRAEIPRHLARRLASHTWPGNVRELRNAIERWRLLADPLRPDMPPLSLSKHCNTLVERTEPEVCFAAAKAGAVRDWERVYVTRLFERHYGNVSQAARAANMDRNHLSNLLRRHRLLD